MNKEDVVIVKPVSRREAVGSLGRAEETRLGRWVRWCSPSAAGGRPTLRRKRRRGASSC